ncbi:MAG TPA: hypothetical protein VM074_06785 [Solimonas sp.]|nr:hypothetical protein [Solimonas sp.]
MKAVKKLQSLQEVVQDLIDRGARSVEEVYLGIAKLPFEALAKISFLEAPAKRAQARHDKSIGAIYDAIRRLNERAGKIAADLLARLDDAPPPPAPAMPAGGKKRAARKAGVGGKHGRR